MNKSIAIFRIRKNVPGVGKRLAKHFDCQEITSQLPMNALDQDSYVVNYGRSTTPAWWDQVDPKNIKVINKPKAVAFSVDKRKSLAAMRDNGIPCLESTTSDAVAQTWLDQGNKVVARTLVKSKKGKGIVLLSPGDAMIAAPLYTKHYEKTHEFRVHVLGGKVIDYVQKKRMGAAKLQALGIEQADLLIRNHRRGWVFARKNIFDFPQIRDLGLRAARAVGLELCAVDILAKFTDGGQFIDAVVCETNSAPGMSDKNTFKAYTKGLEELMATGKTVFPLVADINAPQEPQPVAPPVVAQQPVALKDNPKAYKPSTILGCKLEWEKISDKYYMYYNDKLDLTAIIDPQGVPKFFTMTAANIQIPVQQELQDAPNYVE